MNRSERVLPKKRWRWSGAGLGCLLLLASGGARSHGGKERNCGDKKGQVVYNLKTNPPDLQNSLARFSFFDPFSFNLEQYPSSSFFSFYRPSRYPVAVASSPPPSKFFTVTKHNGILSLLFHRIHSSPHFPCRCCHREVDRRR